MCKKDISKWLKNIDPDEPVKNWPEQFAAVFDRLFGEKHLTWKCFVRSSFASIIAVFLMTLIWGVLRSDDFVGYFTSTPLTHVLIRFVFWILLFNLLADYVSLLETRLVIRFMKSSRLSKILGLATDFILTAGIYFIGFIVGSIISGVVIEILYESLVDWEPTSRNEILSFETLLSVFFPLGQGGLNEMIQLKCTDHQLPFGIYFYSTFFTSLWLWLYVISGFTVKLTQKLNISLNWLKKYLDIDQKPLRSMALVSIMMVTIIFIVWPILR